MSSSTSFRCRLLLGEDYLVVQAISELEQIVLTAIQRDDEFVSVEAAIVLSPQDARRLATNLITMANEVEYGDV